MATVSGVTWCAYEKPRHPTRQALQCDTPGSVGRTPSGLDPCFLVTCYEYGDLGALQWLRRRGHSSRTRSVCAIACVWRLDFTAIEHGDDQLRRPPFQRDDARGWTDIR